MPCSGEPGDIPVTVVCHFTLLGPGCSVLKETTPSASAPSPSLLRAGAVMTLAIRADVVVGEE